MNRKPNWEKSCKKRIETKKSNIEQNSQPEVYIV